MTKRFPKEASKRKGKVSEKKLLREKKQGTAKNSAREPQNRKVLQGTPNIQSSLKNKRKRDIEWKIQRVTKKRISVKDYRNLHNLEQQKRISAKDYGNLHNWEQQKISIKATRVNRTSTF
eukprot:7666102-Ditylum_brightwellii.AAC.1